MTFGKDFYGRKSEARKRITHWVKAQMYKERDINETPPQFTRYRSMAWRDFASNLRDEVAPPETVIHQKLEELGMREEHGELVKA